MPLPLIIPVENQVRELDPKILLALMAVRRGFTVIIGSHREVDFRIASFPRSIYLNKSMTASNLNMFRIMRQLGHRIVSWDEEALVHLPPQTYYSRRLNPEALGFLSHLFAWGEDNAALWREYPHFPPAIPIHVTGNPRGDLLRPEMNRFYTREVEQIRSRYGEFILVNTNFNHVNAFFPALNLFLPESVNLATPQFGKAAVGMSLDYAMGLHRHKQAVFESFQQMIPALATRFPGHAVVVRPHPTERQDAYLRIAAGTPGVHVTNEGNVVPWLLSAKALIHNGCTTGVEAFALGVPALAYRAAVDESYDMGFYGLPNRLSQPCFSLDELCTSVEGVLNGHRGAPGGQAAALLADHMTGMDGPLACERIVSVLERTLQDPTPSPHHGMQRIAGSISAHTRWAAKWLKSFKSGKHAPRDFHRHRYPGIDSSDLVDRVRRFQDILDDPTPIAIDRLSDQIFRMRMGLRHAAST